MTCELFIQAKPKDALSRFYRKINIFWCGLGYKSSLKAAGAKYTPSSSNNEKNALNALNYKRCTSLQTLHNLGP